MGFRSFPCKEMRLIDSRYLSFLFLSSKMKRAGTTGSARGMALYEEEVSTQWVLKPQSGSANSLFSPSQPLPYSFPQNHLPVGVPREKYPFPLEHETKWMLLPSGAPKAKKAHPLTPGAHP